MGVTVRRARAEDREALWDFIHQTWGAGAARKVPERWLWQYARNPAADDGSDALPIWIAETDGRIVGQICAIPVTLQVEEDRYAAAWGADFFVLRGADLRTAYRLAKAVAQHYRIFLVLTMEETTRRIQKALGARELPPVPTFAKPVRLGPRSLRRIFVRLTRNRPRMAGLARFGCDTLGAHRLGCAIVNPVLAARDRLRSMGRSREAEDDGVRIERVQRFEGDVATLFQHAGRPFAVAATRDDRFLNWRFADGGGLDYRLFLARRGAELDGYTVLRRTEPCEMDLGIIVDLFSRTGRPDTTAALIRHAERHFGHDVAGLVCATSLPAQQAALRRAGFLPIHSARPTVWCADPALAGRLARLRDRWFLTRADQDWDQVRPVSDEWST